MPREFEVRWSNAIKLWKFEEVAPSEFEMENLIIYYEYNNHDDRMSPDCEVTLLDFEMENSIKHYENDNHYEVTPSKFKIVEVESLNKHIQHEDINEVMPIAYGRC